MPSKNNVQDKNVLNAVKEMNKTLKRSEHQVTNF